MRSSWATDLVPLALVVGCSLLVWSGQDGEVKAVLTIAGAWCFGKGYLEAKEQIDKRKEK